MAYVNVVEWSPDRVSEWLKGLDDVIAPYIHYFVNNQVDGKRLLQLTPDELPSLHVTKIGHQEIILQGIELLGNIHYQLDQETVQYLALRLSSKARSIHNELRVVTSASRNGGGSAGEEDEGDDDDEGPGRRRERSRKKQERVTTAIIAGVADVLSSVKGLVSWLNRQPFSGVEQYDCLKNGLVELSIGLATIAQRDMFAENQATVILQSCLKLAQISDKIIQEYSDPLIIQPASLDVATIKKKADDEWGVILQGSYHGIHHVSGVRNLSPAHQCGRLEEGDELVQVNYQTVVGWSPHKVLAVMQESPVEVILTIKKRPRHANTNTQIYFKPFRLPSKKRTYSPWGSSVGASSRYDLQSIPNLQLSVSVDKVAMKLKEEPEPRPKSLTPPPVVTAPSPEILPSVSDIPNTPSGSSSDESDLEDDAFLSDNDICGTSPVSVRLYHPKPRAPVQRRATIPGATTRPTFSINQLLQDVRWSRGGLRGFPECSVPSDPDLLRTPSGNDQRIARPHTCIGTEDKNGMGRGSIRSVLKEERVCDNDSVESEDISENSSCKSSNIETDQSQKNKVGEGRVVNIIPLPPRKPATISSPLSQDQVNPATVPHRTPVADKKSHGKIPVSSSRGQLPSTSPYSHSAENAAKHGHEITSELPSKMTRGVDDRPKLDKSHSTPAYDLDGDGSVPLVFPATICEKTPPGHSSPSSSSSTTSTAPKFFDNFESKSALMTSSSVLQQGTCARDTSLESSCKGITRLASSDIDSAGARKHFRSQLLLPAEAQTSNKEHPGIIIDSAVVESEDANEMKLHGSVIGEGSRSNRNLSMSSASAEKAKISKTQQLTAISASHPSSTSSSVVLRETRSSSPSVWRRGLLVTDRGSRRISCRELGQGDHQGWLYRRRDNKGFLLPHRWERRWFILKKNSLYGYRDREAVRADSLVYLPGFHVCPASDVKSKKYSFKIYHSSGATFYFAADSTEERSRWMSQMGLSAISSTPPHRQQNPQQQNQWDDVYYSETDEELEDRTSPSRPSPQSSHSSRVSPSQENVGSLWHGSSSGSSRGPQSRGSQFTSLSSAKNPALKFLQHSKDIDQPVPTASFRSYRRVSDSKNRSTSTGDLRGTTKSDASNVPNERGPQSRVTRKNSLRDRLRQLPASFTLDRRKQVTNRSTPVQQDQQKHNRVHLPQKADRSSPNYQDAKIMQMEKNVKQEMEEKNFDSIPSQSSLSDDHLNDELASDKTGSGTNHHRPHYMLPTCASSLHSPVRPSSVDFDKKNGSSRTGSGCWYGSPPSSGRCSPSKLEHGSRRGSVGGESPVRSRSPRRGSLDCLAPSHPRALSPPMSPLSTPSRISHGSASSLLASEEYREGSPEKLWINSLRADTSKPRANIRTSPEKKDGRSRSVSGETYTSDRLKRTALYHPPQLKTCGEFMKTAFELALDRSSCTSSVTTEKNERTLISVSLSSVQQVTEKESTELQRTAVDTRRRQSKEAGSRTSAMRTHTVPRPEVPPRTKFLSPSERTLPLSGSTPVITSRSSSLSPSSSNMSIISTKSTSSLPGVLSSFHTQPASSPLPIHEDSSSYGMCRSMPKVVPNLSITKLPEELEPVSTPLKPAMGVSMIGKQRRTPGVMPPREVFFSSPPASPTVPFSDSVSSGLPASTGKASSISQPLSVYVARNQKILPHYPGMEYPPVFEPGSYSLCGSPPPDHQVMHYQNLSELNKSCSSSEADGAYATSHCYRQMADLYDVEKGNCSSGNKQQLDAFSSEMTSPRSTSVHNSTGTPRLQNLNVINPVGSRSSQNVYVSSPTGSQPHHNLYVMSPGYSSNQNIYVVSPTARTSSHQNIYVTSPISSTSHQVHASVTSPVTYASSQFIHVGSVSGDGHSECISEGPDGPKSVSHSTAYEEKSCKDGQRTRDSPPKSHGIPTLVLSGSSSSKPDDDGYTDKDNSHPGNESSV